MHTENSHQRLKLYYLYIYLYIYIYVIYNNFTKRNRVNTNKFDIRVNLNILEYSLYWDNKF